jgi:RNA polymerase sigma-70 factor, ECF subfamily
MNEAAKLKAKEPGADEASQGPSARVLEAADRARQRSKSQREAQKVAREEDLRLVSLAKTGDARAFKSLVERNQGRLYAVAFGMMRDRDDAMDVVQDAFIKAHKKLAEFEGNAAFSTWLYRICVNLCIDKKRSDARRKQVDLDDVRASDLGEDAVYAGVDIAPKLSATNPLKTAKDKELGKEIGRALSALTEDHRTILVLREVDGLSYEEIASVLDIPRGTVMSRLFHARKNMQRLLRPFLGLEEGADLSGNPSEGKDEG